MTDESERITELRAALAQGTGGGIDPALREQLGLAPEADDATAARALVEAVWAAEADAIGTGEPRRHDPRPGPARAPVAPANSSFLGMLDARGGGGSGDGMHVEDLVDVRTLIAVLRGGTLRQRRAAALRLGQRVAEGKALSNDAQRLVQEALTQIRDVEVAYELSLAREKLHGGAGREARDEHDRWQRLAARVEADVARFWDTELAKEPIAALDGEERAMLLLRLRELGDRTVDHVCAGIEATDGVTDRAGRHALLSSLRSSGDPRLIPSLCAVLATSERELVIEAARVLGRIDDPRARIALGPVYDRAVLDAERAVLAGALAQSGDSRGASTIRRLLASEDDAVVLMALDALRSFASFEDPEPVLRVLERPDPGLVLEAVRALQRVGDARALAALARLRDRTGSSALWAEIEDAEASIRARLELRGEEPPALESASRTHDAIVKATTQTVRDPALVRLRSWWDSLVGRPWLVLGALERAVARFEAAAARRPRWCAPLLAIGLAYARRDLDAQALGAFRRAIDVSRGEVERHPTVVRAVVRAFLRRADEMEHQGRRDIARGLLEEAMSIDLRRAGAAQRIEVDRRHRALRGSFGAEARAPEAP